MARLPPTIDAGSYSTLCCRVTNKQHRANHLASDALPSRTRSRFQPEAARAPVLPATAKSSRISKQHHRSASGALARTSLRKRDVAAAKQTLCKSRLALKQYLESDKFRDYHGRILFDIYQQIRQLSCLSPSGALGTVPSPLPKVTNSPERLEAARARRRKGPSPLGYVERITTEEEMDQEYGVLPGEEWHDCVALEVEVEMEIAEYATAYGRILEGMYDGEEMEGVWRGVAAGGETGCEIAARWALRQVALSKRASEGAVMGKHCIGVVRGIWEMACIC
ncbi:hypothetical protein BKA66DRAFT_443122 [Pyrenochaeta sp. MPI-SDFR-AT-0127]|nr:hypothetical protein BKA66DRAFT_443122 [Pyrenochaeta sp. MPI-SDFR-AT-0127]